MTLGGLSDRFFAVLGRAPVEGEVASFAAMFRGADLPRLDHAIRVYLARGERFLSVAGLFAAYQQADPSAAGQAGAAAAWIGSGMPGYLGWQGGGRGADPERVRSLMVRHHAACGEDAHVAEECEAALEGLGWYMPVEARIDWPAWRGCVLEGVRAQQPVADRDLAERLGFALPADMRAFRAAVGALRREGVVERLVAAPHALVMARRDAPEEATRGPG